MQIKFWQSYIYRIALRCGGFLINTQIKYKKNFMTIRGLIINALLFSLISFICAVDCHAHKEFKLPNVEAFIAKWSKSAGSELGSSQAFINDLCLVLGVDKPEAPRQELNNNDYVFEKQVTFRDGKSGRIDLYKKSFFVWESKQGSNATKNTEPFRKGTAIRNSAPWDAAMIKAFNQALGYVKSLPGQEGRPPFIIVADIGYVIHLYADFNNVGLYTPFPDPYSNRILIEDFRKPEVIELFKKIWEDPLSLNPSIEKERVTNAIAVKLGELAKSLEDSNYDSDTIAIFMMRIIFTMFAEDIGLIEKNSFANMVYGLKDPKDFLDEANVFFEKTELKEHGGFFFIDAKAIDLNAEQLAILRESIKADWSFVDTSIFGTLLERALSKKERRKMGAHYTPTAYAERLVIPTVIEPLRLEWDVVVDYALNTAVLGEHENAIAAIEKFYKKLSSVVVLDPSSGSGNFLSVSLNLLSELEGEVIQALKDLGLTSKEIQDIGYKINVKQFRGIESNKIAAAISELVLHISSLQRHYRTYGNIKPEPVDPYFKAVENRDAVLAWDSISKDSKGDVVYINPRPADAWPRTDFIVGNPPFIGANRKRINLGSGYVDALTLAYKNLHANLDYVMYWWYRSAKLLRNNEIQSFGFITTNSIRQKQNRKIVDMFLNGDPPLSIVFAIPDHPWVAGDADVRISMATLVQGDVKGIFVKVKENDDGELDFKSVIAKIFPDLSITIDVSKLFTLKSNLGVSYRGVARNAKCFLITREQAKQMGLGTLEGLDRYIRPILNGNDISGISRDLMVIYLYGLDIETIKVKYPLLYQWLLNNVKPERDKNRIASLRDKWWLPSSSATSFMKYIKDLDYYIATSSVAKHRIFVTIPSEIVPDSGVISFPTEDYYILGVLSSSVHKKWAFATGGFMGKTPRYVNSMCFDTFPFPEVSEEQKDEIRVIAKKIDDHRKSKKQKYPELRLSRVYSIIEKINNEEELDDKEQKLCDKYDIRTLKNLHEELDNLVLKSYGWKQDLTTEELLLEVFELNQKRGKDEENGNILWLCPEIQLSEFFDIDLYNSSQIYHA